METYVLSLFILKLELCVWCCYKFIYLLSFMYKFKVKINDNAHCIEAYVLKSLVVF